MPSSLPWILHLSEKWLAWAFLFVVLPLLTCYKLLYGFRRNVASMSRGYVLVASIDIAFESKVVSVNFLFCCSRRLAMLWVFAVSEELSHQCLEDMPLSLPWILHLNEKWLAWTFLFVVLALLTCFSFYGSFRRTVPSMFWGYALVASIDIAFERKVVSVNFSFCCSRLLEMLYFLLVPEKLSHQCPDDIPSSLP